MRLSVSTWSVSLTEPSTAYTRGRRHSGRAFSLIELLVVVVVIAILMSLFLPALRGARKEGRKAVCMANMQQLGRAHAQYEGDFKQFIAAFNGRAGDGAVDVHGDVAIPRLSQLEAQAVEIVAPFLPNTGIVLTY